MTLAQSERAARPAFPDIHNECDAFTCETLLHRVFQCGVHGQALAHLRFFSTETSLRHSQPFENTVNHAPESSSRKFP